MSEGAAAKSVDHDNDRHNLWVLAWYTVSLRCGWIFKTEAVVMPAVVDLLAGTAGAAGWVRGLLPLLNKFGQSVPPLLAADLVRRRPLKKRPLALASGAMAVVFAAVAGLWTLRGSVSSTWLVVGFLTLYAVFFAAVGLNGLAFNTVQGKLIRANRRGRLLGIGSIVGSLAAVGLAWLLMPRWLEWPNATGFVPIFLTSASGYAVASMLCGSLREARDETTDTAPRRAFADVITLLKSDGRFRLAALVAGLTASSQIVFPHYQWIGREMLDSEIGDLFWWVMAQNLTVAVAGPMAGMLGDRFGNRLALRTMVALSLSPPALAAALLWSSRSGFDDAGRYFWCVFMLLGLTPVTVKTILNYTLELAKPEDHPRYVASMQTCFAVPFLISPVAGLLVDATTDKAIGVTCLIGLVAGGLITAFLLTFRLVEVRHEST